MWLQRVLGFQHTQGHRQWRRFKKKLVDTGRLKESVGIQNGAYASVLKLEQPLLAAPVLSCHQDRDNKCILGPCTAVLPAYVILHEPFGSYRTVEYYSIASCFAHLMVSAVHRVTDECCSSC